MMIPWREAQVIYCANALLQPSLKAGALLIIEAAAAGANWVLGRAQADVCTCANASLSLGATTGYFGWRDRDAAYV